MADWIQYTGDSLFDAIIDCFIARCKPTPDYVRNPRVNQVFNCYFSTKDEIYRFNGIYKSDFNIMFSIGPERAGRTRSCEQHYIIVFL